MTALTPAEKQRAYREREKAKRLQKREAGLKEVVGIWAPPDHHAPIKAFAASLKREKQDQSKGKK